MMAHTKASQKTWLLNQERFFGDYFLGGVQYSSEFLLLLLLLTIATIDDTTFLSFDILID
jgi:hypothetical protein